MTRNTLHREGITLKSTCSSDAAGLAPPTAPWLLWRLAMAVSRTASPFVSGAAPPSTASLRVIAAFGSLGVAGDGGSQDCKLGCRRQWQARKPPPSMGQVGGEGMN
jgi:hypothetical protein